MKQVTNPVGLTNYKSGIKQEPKIAISGKNLYIIWSDYSLGPAEIFFTKSTDNGHKFQQSTCIRYFIWCGRGNKAGCIYE